MQKLIYILEHYGIKLPYNFTWWKYGPYSPQLADDIFKHGASTIMTDLEPEDLQFIDKIKDAKDILMDSRKAELIASFLYLKKRMVGKSKNDVVDELLRKKPYFTQEEINQAMLQWDRIEGHILSDK